MWRGRAGHGRAGQAFELVESGVVDRATANSSPQTATGHDRMTRPLRRSPRRKLLADSGSEPGVNASPLIEEPAARATRHDGRTCSRVGWTFPAAHAKCNSLRIEHPIRTLTYCALVTHRSNRDLCLSCENYLLE